MAEETHKTFGGAAQFGLDFGDAKPAPIYEPDRDEVRRELQQVLAEAKGATDECPWDGRTLAYHKVVFPQMANWLPAEERDQLRFEFANHVERIERLLAA